MTKLNVSEVALLHAETFYREHRAIHTHDGERVDLESLAFIFQHCIDEHTATTNNAEHHHSCSNSKEEHSDEYLKHVPCVMARYNISDADWDATPTRLQAALLQQCAVSE